MYQGYQGLGWGKERQSKFYQKLLKNKSKLKE